MGKNAEIIQTVIGLAIIILVGYFFSDYIETGFSYVVVFIAVLIGVALLGVIHLLYITTKKWLTTGLNEGEKDWAVRTLVIIFLGLILFAIYYFIMHYFDVIETVMIHIVRIVIFGFGIFMFFVLVLFPTFQKFFPSSDKKKSEPILLIAIISLIASIIIELLYGEIIVSWFKTIWYYPVGGIFLISIITIILKNIKKPNP